MPISRELAEKTLVKLRERYRGQYPTERLILYVDRRTGSTSASHVVAIPSSSAWFDLLPPEQVVEILDQDAYERAQRLI